MHYFRDSAKYLNELTKYGTVAYAEYLDDMVKLMIERGIDVAIPILAEARASFGASVSSTQAVLVKVLDVAPAAGEN